MVFPRSKTGPAILASLQISYKSDQRARNYVWNWKNSEFVNNQKWSKLKIITSWDRNFVHPQFLEEKTWATRSYGKRLGLPLNYSRTQRTLSHHTHKCGYKHLYGAKLAFFIFCYLLLNFLKCLFYDTLRGHYRSNTVHSTRLEPINNHHCLCQQKQILP